MNRTLPFALQAATLAAALALPAGAFAHHGWGWTEDEETRLEGTIEDISFGNPHMHIKLRVPAGGGQSELWSVDLSPPIQAQRSGFGPGAAKVGGEVVLTGHRARDADLRGFKAETVTVGSRTYDVYPSRDKTLRTD